MPEKKGESKMSAKEKKENIGSVITGGKTVIQKNKVNEGDKAPAFCLKNAAEQQVCLKDFLGQWVVLYFYPKDNTPGCTLEAKDFTKELPGFEDLDAVILGVSADSCESHRKFIAGQKLAVTLLSDESHDTLNAYGVWGEKNMMGKKFMGTSRTTFLIDPKGKIAGVWYNVKAEGHAEEVKNKLKQIESKK
jgi:peroxiredoxin Q/BCP